MLYNGQGNYRAAAEAAHRASAVDEIVISPWALYELVEAATRNDQTNVLARRLISCRSWPRRTPATGPAGGGTVPGPGIRGTRRRRGIPRGDRAAGQNPDGDPPGPRPPGLRRMAAPEKRRAEARDQLRSAFDTLTSMGAEAFAERAPRELLATGEPARKRSDDTRTDLTPQEEEIAQLAREGRTNQEIAAQLFIAARTVEWHLRKVFAKLDISSRLGSTRP